MIFFGMRFCEDYGESKRVKNLCTAEILSEYVGLANYLESVMIITTIY